MRREVILLYFILSGNRTMGSSMKDTSEPEVKVRDEYKYE